MNTRNNAVKDDGESEEILLPKEDMEKLNHIISLVKNGVSHKELKDKHDDDEKE